MKFSFIIPVYNTSRYLDQCVTSILSQTRVEYEVILVDDGSTDGSAVMCDQYEKKYSNVNVIHQKNSGLSAARNAGVRKATGDYFFVVDSDDFWLGDYLAQIEEICEKNPDLIVFGYQTFTVKNNLEIVTGKYSIFADIFEKNGACFLQSVMEKALRLGKFYQWNAWCYCYKRSFFVENKFSWPERENFEDLRLTWHVILAAGQVEIFDENVYAYRKGVKSSITSVNNFENVWNRLLQTIRNMEEIEADTKMNERLKELLRDHFSENYFIVLTLSDLPATRSERNTIMEELKKNIWISNCSLRKNEQFVAWLISHFGLSFTCRLLHLRRKVVYHGQFRRAK